MAKNDTKKWLARIKRHIARVVPDFLLLGYHFIFAVAAMVWYRHPSKELVVIGVTGTKGKTSTASYMHTALTAAGKTVGLLSTAEVRIGREVHTNKRHMTLPGRGYVQQQLRKMVTAGCQYAIIETPSEGIRQFRVFGVWYDSLVYTNLSPEHLVTHKTFERYRHTKGLLFKQQAQSPQKVLHGKPVKRYIILNADDGNVEYFQKIADTPLNEQLVVGFGEKATIPISTEKGSDENAFTLEEDRYVVPLPGIITVQNAVPAILLAKRYGGVSPEQLNDAFTSTTLPGRLERIEAGQPFQVYCDYAHEPLSIESVCEALRQYVSSEDGRLLIVVGAVGASRWRYNATKIGEVAGQCADVAIITDVDPFFDDPEEIARAVVSGIRKNKNAEWYVELNRRKAIEKAFALAKKGDVVIVTGKGAEVTMEVNGESIPWDERAIIREILQNG
ncbi:MAG: UDP-N-acetylmuramyl-tripeptide synthetase [Candidatus Kaiserbacteria bacterium]|nr:UDP-N-acetylmuramyl-tripeptide synthetase [Candidatus Kaiserbacteria bacterium]